MLVHGGAANAHWWGFIAPQLARGYHVVAPDLSGHGDSGWRPDYPREVWSEEIMTVAALVRYHKTNKVAKTLYTQQGALLPHRGR